MIRARNAINPNHSCHSADVLTGPERFLQRLQELPDVPKHRQDVECRYGMRWGDAKHIRDVLESIRGKV